MLPAAAILLPEVAAIDPLLKVIGFFANFDERRPKLWARL